MSGVENPVTKTNEHLPGSLRVNVTNAPKNKIKTRPMRMRIIPNITPAETERIISAIGWNGTKLCHCVNLSLSKLY